MRSSTASLAAGVPSRRSPFLRSRSSSASWNGRHGFRPEVWVSRWRIVTASLPRSPKDGSTFATGSSRSMRPSDASSIIDVAVTIGLVSDARSKIVSRAIAMRSGRSTALPRTDSWVSTSPSRGMRASTTAPGAADFAIA